MSIDRPAICVDSGCWRSGLASLRQGGVLTQSWSFKGLQDRVRLRAESKIAPAVDVHGNRCSRVSGPRGVPSLVWALLGRHLGVTPAFGEGASGGVSLSRASELSESSDEDCSARDLAGLHKVWHKLKYYTLVILDAWACSDFMYSQFYQGPGPRIPL